MFCEICPSDNLENIIHQLMTVLAMNAHVYSSHFHNYYTFNSLATALPRINIHIVMLTHKKGRNTKYYSYLNSISYFRDLTSRFRLTFYP